MAMVLRKEARTAVARSGYLMEQRLASFIRNRGYYTVPNHAFRDPETGETREIDVWAMGAEIISERKMELIYPVLLIECKNLRAPLVFFTQHELRLRVLMGDVHLSGLPKEVLRNQEREHICDFLKFEKFHHYYQRSRISSQFCAVYKNKKGHWIAGHELEGVGNLYQQAIIPLLKAVYHESHEHESSWQYIPGEEVINLQFYYPILVTRGELYECFVGGKRPRYRRVHRVHFIRRYHSKTLSGEYRIDVVTESGFRRLIRTIEDEIEEIGKRIRRRRTLLRQSANLIAREKLRKIRQGASKAKGKIQRRTS